MDGTECFARRRGDQQVVDSSPVHKRVKHRPEASSDCRAIYCAFQHERIKTVFQPPDKNLSPTNNRYLLTSHCNQ